MYIDTHAHLYFADFNTDLQAVMDAAMQAGVEKIIVPATDLQSARRIVQLTGEQPGLYGAAGIHPHDSKDWTNSDATALFQLATECQKIVAIGEIGLDYHYDFSPREKQIEAFRAQIELAIDLDLPAIIHNRESDEDMLSIVNDYAGKGLRAQFHCFNADLKFAERVLAMGHLISFTGNITFKKMNELRDIAKYVPLGSILLETDAPFMTPVPYRGKRNEPKYVVRVAEMIAELKGVSVEEIARVTTANANRFFGLTQIRKTAYTYKLYDALYINITNRCNANCVFCARATDPVIRGYNLGMSRAEEKGIEIYLREIEDPKKYSEIVFCGYGEPTIRWELVKEIAAWVKANGGSTRLNTNGHGNVINKRDITPEMKGIMDCVSVSLNSHDRKQYADLMQLPERFYDAMLEFASLAKANVPSVVLSVVGMPEVEIAEAKQVADKLGVEFRVRPYF